MSELKLNSEDRGLQYVGTSNIDGPLVVVERVRDVGFDEIVEVVDAEGKTRLGRVLDISFQHAVIQVLEGTTGLSNQLTRVRFLGESFRLPVSRGMLGRVFDGLPGRSMADRPRFPPIGGTLTAYRSTRTLGSIRGSSSRRDCRPSTA